MSEKRNNFWIIRKESLTIHKIFKCHTTLKLIIGQDFFWEFSLSFSTYCWMIHFVITGRIVNYLLFRIHNYIFHRIVKETTSLSTSSVEAPITFCITCHRIAGSESSSHRFRAGSVFSVGCLGVLIIIHFPPFVKQKDSIDCLHMLRYLWGYIKFFFRSTNMILAITYIFTYPLLFFKP